MKQRALAVNNQASQGLQALFKEHEETKKRNTKPKIEWAINGDKGIYTTPVKLGDYLLKHYHFKYFQRGFNEELYEYIPSKGLWQPTTKRQIDQIVTKKLKAIDNWSRRKMNDTTAYLLSLVETADANRTINDVVDVDKVHFKNGVYSFKADQLLSHSPNYYFSRGRDYSIVTKEEPTPNTDKWLIESIGEDAFRMLKKYIGYLFYRTNETWQVFIILLADGGDGKSTFFNWLNEVIGDENASTTELEKLAIENNKFALSTLVGKSLNYDADITNALIKKPDKLKKITGNDRIDVEEKGKNAYKAKIYTKLMFAGNDLPAFKDNTGGFKRRSIIIPFYKIPDFKDRYSLKTIYQEIPKFTYKCLRAFWKSHNQDELEQTPTMKKLSEEWMGTNNHVMEFVDDYCTIKADAREQKVYVYQAYKEFCFENGYKPLSSVQFTKELERLDTTPKIEDKTAKIKGKAYKAYINLELKPTLTIEE